jgi:hypothetical protein
MISRCGCRRVPQGSQQSGEAVQSRTTLGFPLVTPNTVKELLQKLLAALSGLLILRRDYYFNTHGDFENAAAKI